MKTSRQLGNFINTLELWGDVYFSTGNKAKDYKYIKSVINRQGYWSGVKLRYYFNDNLELVYTTERVFGSDTKRGVL